jgi:hypothetical protein
MPNSDESHGGSPDASWTRNLLAALIVVVLVLLTVFVALYLARRSLYNPCGFSCPGTSSVSRAPGP